MLCVTVAAVATAARCLPFMAPGVRFDADQAVVGLMAKHISEGRAFPVFFYGQSYLLAVEAYLAAPVMWVLGPTEVALKLPLLVMNATTTLLLIWRLQRDVGLSAGLALAAALPLALPPVVPGVRLMDAIGGNIEPLLYTLALWVLRDRMWLFAVALGLFVAHRELSLYAALALGLLGLWHQRGPSWALVRHWAVAALLVVVAQTAVQAVRPFGAMFGPGTKAETRMIDLSVRSAIGAQVCVAPSTWPVRARALVTGHAPFIVGGLPGPMVDAGVNSGMGQGNPGLALWVLAITAVGVVSGLAGARPARRGEPTGIPGTWLPGYLLLVGTISTAVYGFVACSNISPLSLRYNLLAVFLPVGALAAGLVSRHRAVRAGLVTATVMWTALSAGDYAALGREIRAGHWPDYRGDAVRALEARGIHTLWGEYRLGYILSFRSQERLIVAPVDVHRIDDYARRAAERPVPLVTYRPCPAGELLVRDIWLCPTPEPLPPVY